MTEAVFAGKNVEKLALEKIFRRFAAFFAKLARFAENFFLRDRPSDARRRDGQNNERINFG